MPSLLGQTPSTICYFGGKLMKDFKAWMVSLSAVLAILLANPVLAQTVPEITGSWHGLISLPTGDLTLVLRVDRDENGALSATLENFDQAPGRLEPVTDVSASDGRLTFRVAEAGATYAGNWDETAQRWKGTLTQGAALPLEFERGAPPPRPVVTGLDGVWEGVVELNGVALRQILRFRTLDEGTFALYDSPDQLVNGAPLIDLARDGDRVSFSAFRGLSRFLGTLSDGGDRLTGAWSTPGQADVSMTFTRRAHGSDAGGPNRPQEPRPPFPYRVENVAFDNPAAPGVRLAGTLTLPEGDGPFPAAILLTGSGPQDRDESLMGHKPFAVLADHLTRNGIAVLRYDDRGVGESTGVFSEATSPDHASDANAAFAWLSSRPEIRGDAIGFIGHSEGGVTAPIAMADNPAVAWFVGLAPPGTSLVQLLLSQRRLVATQMGVSEADLDRSEPVVVAMFRAIATADTPQAGRAAAMAVLTPEARTALGLPPEVESAEVVRSLSAPWLHYLLRYDPAANLARIDVPVLVVIGGLDRQVPPAENLAAIREALRDNPDVTLVEAPGLNHLFQTAKTGGMGEYATIEETFSPGVLTLLSDWINERFPSR